MFKERMKMYQITFEETDIKTYISGTSFIIRDCGVLFFNKNEKCAFYSNANKIKTILDITQASPGTY